MTDDRMIIVYSDKDTGKTKIVNRVFRDNESINQYYAMMRNRIEALIIVLPYSHLPRIRKLQKEEEKTAKLPPFL